MEWSTRVKRARIHVCGIHDSKRIIGYTLYNKKFKKTQEKLLKFTRNFKTVQNLKLLNTKTEYTLYVCIVSLST